MSNRFKLAIEFVFFCIPIILLIVLFSTKTFSTQATFDTDRVINLKEHLVTSDVYVVCLNGVKYYYVEDGISRMGIAPVYGTDGKVMLCKRR